MSQLLTYEIIDLNSARDFLNAHPDYTVIANPADSVKYYGMRTLDYMFKKLYNEFPQIAKIIVNVDDDHAALFTAIKLGYKNINYSGNSEEAKIILKNNYITIL